MPSGPRALHSPVGTHVPHTVLHARTMQWTCALYVKGMAPLQAQAPLAWSEVVRGHDRSIRVNYDKAPPRGRSGLPDRHQEVGIS